MKPMKKLYLKHDFIKELGDNLKEECENTEVPYDPYYNPYASKSYKTYYEWDSTEYCNIISDFDESLPNTFEDLPKELAIEIKAYWHSHQPVYTFPVSKDDLELDDC